MSKITDDQLIATRSDIVELLYELEETRAQLQEVDTDIKWLKILCVGIFLVLAFFAMETVFFL